MGSGSPFLSSMVTVSFAHFIRNLGGAPSISMAGENEGLGRKRFLLLGLEAQVLDRMLT